MTRATSQARAMSVAVGMAQPLATVPKSSLPPYNSRASRKNRPTGPNTPPRVPISGLMALGMGFSAPPGRIDSVISLAAMPKKKTMNTSLTRKWTVMCLPKI